LKSIGIWWAGCGPRLAGLVNGAIGIRANALGFALIAAFGDDDFDGELTGFVFWPIALFLVGRLFAVNLDILVARGGGAVVLRRPVCRTDLYQLRFHCNSLAHVRIDLCSVAPRIRVLVRVGRRFALWHPTDQKYFKGLTLGPMSVTSDLGVEKK